MDWLVEEHIYRRNCSFNRGTGNLPADILLAADTLTGKNISRQSPESEPEYEANEPYIRKLSGVVVWSMDICSILHHLQPNTRAEQKYERHKRITNTVEAAATYVGDLDFFIRLINEQGVIDASENMYFGNPLRTAILQNHFHLAVFLLDNGVYVNHGKWGTGFGKTALQAAGATGQHRFVELLLYSWYGCHTSGREFDSAVLNAVSGGHLPVFRYFMERRNIDPTLEFCNRMLMEAAMNRREEM
ncbi:hypothetical protein BKA65DRAFT_513911 [Rhexocercosporidium sp. MPI-PUGE-AT-0058]|nr:hypothetical protein BKA65DRAFT_513911 [Rhexocercosporidium sp. MPI-PUGE-AT-0058]